MTAVDVEIKVNVEGAQVEKAMQVFDLDPDDAKKRAIWFGEIVTGGDGRGALPLLGRGVILRVRAKKRDAGDVTLKLRGPDGCIDVPAWTERVRDLADAEIEGDWADRHLVSASLTADFGRAGRDELETAAPSIVALMSDEQKKLAHELFVPLDDVVLLGPITARKWEHEHDGDVDAEEWTVGDLHFLEISVVAAAEPEKAQQELRQRALDGGLEFEEGQEPKTTRVLRHLAGQG